MYYLLFDTETGGLDPAVRDVLQLAWQVVDERFGTVASRSFFLRPTLDSEPEALAVNRLDPVRVASLASDPAYVYGLFQSDLLACGAIIGHYVSFDRAFVIADSCRRLGNWFSENLGSRLDSMPCFDTKTGTASLKDEWKAKTRPGPHLHELCEFLGVGTDDIYYHSADGDVEAVRRCLVSLKEMYPDLLEPLLETYAA